MTPGAPGASPGASGFAGSAPAPSTDDVLGLLSNLLPDCAMLRLDPAGRITMWGAGAEQALGYRAPEVLGKPLAELFAPHERAAAELALATAARGGVLSDEWTLAGSDCRPRTLSARLTAAIDASGAVREFVLLLREPSDRALREREAWHRAISELTSDYASTARVHADGRIVVEAVTDGFAKVTGYTLDELEIAGGWAAIIHPDDMPAAEASIRRLLSGERDTSEIRIRRKDGQTRWVRYLARPALDDSGRVTHVYGAAQDITEEKRYQHELVDRQRLATFGRDVGLALSSTEPLPAILRRCAVAMVEHLGAGGARIWTANDAGDTLELQAGAGLPTDADPAHMRVPVGAPGVGLIARDRAPLVSADTDDDTPERTWAQGHGCNAFAGYPLVAGGRLVGVMALFAPAPFADATLDALASIAPAIAVGVERKRAENAVQQQKDWLRTTLSSIGDGVIATDASGRVMFLNTVAETLTAWRTDEAMGRRLADIFHIVNEHTRGRVDDPVAKVLRERRIVGLASHTVLVARDGTERPIHDSAAPIQDDRGELLGVVLVFRDATDQARAERERDQLFRQLEFERSRFEAVIRQLPAGVIVAEAPSGRLLLANEQVRQILGHESLAAPGMEQYGAYSGFHTDGRPYAPSEWPLVRSISTGEVVVGEEFVYRRGDGAEVVLRANSAPVRDSEGNIIAGVVAFDDVTAERAAEDALFRREQEFKALAENAPDIIARFDRNFRHVYVNPAVERASNVKASEFLGKTNRDLGMAPELCLMWEEAYRRVFETGRETVIEFSYPAPGEPRHFQSRVVPEFDREGSVATILGMTRDITERKRLESELRQNLERLADADRRKDEFLAMLAHELRNPLAPMYSALGVLKRPDLDEHVLARVRDVMERQVANLTRLVDDLLDVSRITRGKIELRPERTNLELVIRRAVDAVQPIMDARGHRVAVDLPPNTVALAADPTRLEQVLTNLLNNAAKYTEPGGEVSVSCEALEREVILRVKDTGIGIAPELLPHIFDLFVQAENTLDRAHGGLGLGLTLVRKLVEMHGGSVHALSNGPGTGSEFVVRLPLMVGEAPSAGTEAPAGNTAAHGPSRRILVVDDNVDAAESLALMLEMMGHDVRVVHDGPSALEATTRHRPDVIFLDIGLPGMNGYDVARRLREMALTPSPVIAALTGWGQAQDRLRSKEAGCHHHLVKPADAEVIGQLLRRLPTAI